MNVGGETGCRCFKLNNTTLPSFNFRQNNAHLSWIELLPYGTLSKDNMFSSFGLEQIIFTERTGPGSLTITYVALSSNFKTFILPVTLITVELSLEKVYTG